MRAVIVVNAGQDGSMRSERPAAEGWVTFEPMVEASVRG